MRETGGQKQATARYQCPFDCQCLTHFSGEFPGVDADFLDYDKHYPTKEFQLSWIREYLGEGATQKEVEELQRMVDRFSALPHLM